MLKSTNYCKVCGSEDFSTAYKDLPSMYSNFRANIDECSGCGHGLTNPSPDSETVKNIYLNTYSIPSQELVRQEKKRNSQLLVRWMLSTITPTKVLEVGCMFGDLLAVFEEYSLPAFGVELDEFATFTANKEGRDVVCGNFEKMLKEHYQFDADTIVLVHCLEHFVDPKYILDTLYKNYPQVQNVFIVVPNFQSTLRRLLGKYWGSFQVGIHFHHFSAESLEVTLLQTGWSIKSLKFSGADSIFSEPHLLIF